MKYHKIIQDEIDRLHKIIKKIQGLQPVTELAEKASLVLGDTYLRIKVCGDDIRLEFAPNTIKDVKKCLIFFGKHKYFIEWHAEHGEDNYASWMLLNKHNCLRINIAAYYYKDSQSCKFVQTGIKEVPIMELVCE